MDVLVASTLLVLVSPVLVFAAVGIKLTSPGPVLFKARRVGRDRRRLHRNDPPGVPGIERRSPGYRGVEFTLYKFRTMRVMPQSGAPITARGDFRIFPFGAFLRATKIDELPQLINVIHGDMAIVGPRPEAPEIVRTHYSADDISTLQVAPGVTSPGSLYYYTHLEHTLDGDDVVDRYAQQVLPVKLAVDRVYLRQATLSYDLRLLFRTAGVIVGRCLGRRQFADPPEIEQIRQ